MIHTRSDEVGSLAIDVRWDSGYNELIQSAYCGSSENRYWV